MEEQRLVVPKEEEEGTENGGRDPLIVQVRTLGDFLTQHGTSHLKPESKDEMHQCWDSQWQEFLKSVARLPIAPSPLEENAADSQASLGRDKEDPQEESSGEARGKSVLQRDPSMDQKAWMGREKLDSSIKVKVEEIQEEVNLESQALLSLRQFSSQDAEEHQETSELTFFLSSGISNSGGYDANISQIRERKLGCSEGEASLEKNQENEGEANSLTRRRREQESDEARAARLQDQRVRTKRKRGRETGEERHTRLQKDKERQRQRRKRETEEKKHARLQEQRERTKRRRYEETVEERAARLQKDRERHRMRRQAETEKKREDPPENMWRREISAGVAEHNPCLNREKTKQNAQLLQEGSTMEEQKHVVCKEEEGTEKAGRDPLIVQVRSIGDFLTNDSPSHIKMESEDELYQCWDSERQEHLKRVAGFPTPPSLLEDDAKDFQFPLGRVKEDLQEESSGEARGKTLLQRDLNISGKAWMGREKLDFCMKGEGGRDSGGS
ncbi:hypothetical protein NXF25_004460 [Crotalus adamanteus]|uniref:Uncharacterized protein n=1 Tax=Crotalus adamanteus TaxID=8729 RepID=A0AAW1BV01_CROAD